MKIAVFGCLHGMLNEMYASVERLEIEKNETVDLIIVCGDCQTIRHFDDLRCLCVPQKYKKLGDFHEYYSGKRKVPKLTIFVGGNHEASNYLMTLPYGGWVCENFYYLGYSGVVRYKGLRIAGVSGIYNRYNCNKGRFESMPLNNDTVKSVYHTRRLDIFRLQLLAKNAGDKDPIDIFMSHDWPSRIYDYGDRNQLIRFKPHFKSDIETNRLGSPLTEPLSNQLKPKKWFAAHLHCRFSAKIVHDANLGRCTEFLALNKIENGRNYMELIDFTPSRDHDTSDNDLYYDEEWLTILRKTFELESNSVNNVFIPRFDDSAGQAYQPTDDEIHAIVDQMNRTGGLKIQNNFRMSEPVIYDREGAVQPSLDRNRMRFYPNYQTEDLRSRLGVIKTEIKTEVKTEYQPKTKTDPPASSTQDDDDGDILPFSIEKKEPAVVRFGVKTEHVVKTEHDVKPQHKITPRGFDIKKESGFEIEPTSKKYKTEFTE